MDMKLKETSNKNRSTKIIHVRNKILNQENSGIKALDNLKHFISTYKLRKDKPIGTKY